MGREVAGSRWAWVPAEARRQSHGRRFQGKYKPTMRHHSAPVAPVLLFVLLGACASTPIKESSHMGSVVSAEGVSIHYRVDGAQHHDPSIVLVHGYGADSNLWNEQVDHLALTRRVIRLDLAGHGLSGADRTDWTMEAFGEDVRAVCDAVGTQRVVLVGHSMGGPVIIEAARLMGPRVIGLVPVDTLHDVESRMPEPQVQGILAQWKSDYRGATTQWVRSFLFVPTSDPAIVASITAKLVALRSDIGLSLLDAMFHYDAAARMDGLTVPVHCINATYAQPTNLEAGRRHARSFDAELMTGVGHYPMLETPAEFRLSLDATLEPLLR